MKALTLVLIVMGLILFGCTEAQKDCGTDKQYVCGEDGVTYTNECYAKSAGVNVEYQGTCTASGATETCVDTDGGKNALEYGATSKGGSSFNDSCNPVDSKVVYEYYCDGNAITSSSVTCPGGMECSAGKCVQGQPSCTDTDNGQVVWVKGTTTAGGESAVDVCYDGSTVKEYYCFEGAVKESLASCPQGETCQDGECIASTGCSDTDGGYAIFERGTVRDGDMLYTDYCTNSYMLEEYYCSQEGVSWYSVDCGEGSSCVNGECTAASCTDSDDGQDKYEEGTVREGSEEWTDYCVDSDTVKEYYCSGDSAKTTELGCSSGYYCDDGECVQEEDTCSDSDGGIKRSIFGKVNEGFGYVNDACSGIYSLVEQYCSGGHGYAQTIDCLDYDEYCYNGICSPAHCSDSDGGTVYDGEGSVTTSTDNGFSDTNYDYCVNDRTLKEYYCSGVEMKDESHECRELEICNEGECITARCEDSDGGKIYTVKGTVTQGAVSNTDTCVSTMQLREYFCTDGEIASTTYACSCSSGKCTGIIR